MSWDPKAAAKQYLVEVSTSQAVNADGRVRSTVEKITTDSTAAAPTLLAIGGTTYLNGGTLYWHVAAKDADGNVGSYTSIQTLTLPAKLVATSSKPSITEEDDDVGDDHREERPGQPDLERVGQGVRRRDHRQDPEDGRARHDDVQAAARPRPGRSPSRRPSPALRRRRTTITVS